jgi:hypothetical protein
MIELADVAHHEQHFIDGCAIGHCVSLDLVESGLFGATALSLLPSLNLSGQAPRTGPLETHFLRYVKSTVDK